MGLALKPAIRKRATQLFFFKNLKNLQKVHSHELDNCFRRRSETVPLTGLK